MYLWWLWVNPPQTWKEKPERQFTLHGANTICTLWFYSCVEIHFRPRLLYALIVWGQNVAPLGNKTHKIYLHSYLAMATWHGILYPLYTRDRMLRSNATNERWQMCDHSRKSLPLYTLIVGLRLHQRRSQIIINVSLVVIVRALWRVWRASLRA